MPGGTKQGESPQIRSTGDLPPPRHHTTNAGPLLLNGGVGVNIDLVEFYGNVINSNIELRWQRQL